MTRIFLGPVVALALLAGGVACSKKAEGARYPLTGIVVAMDDGTGKVLIEHAQIRGFMPAMTMPYKVIGAPGDLRAGDGVKTTLVVNKDTEWLEDLSVTKKAVSGFAPISALPAAAVLGTPVPDFLLVDQDGQAMHLGQFHGSVLMLTFIYTRCPFPDFCPLMMKNFNEVRKVVAGNPEAARKVRFLSISLDPDYDTPAVLRAYGERFIPAEDRFGRWSLGTAQPSQIRAIASYFGVSYSKDGDQINHSLSTAIIGGDGRLITLMAGNAWQPGDAAAIVTKAALAVH